MYAGLSITNAITTEGSSIRYSNDRDTVSIPTCSVKIRLSADTIAGLLLAVSPAWFSSPRFWAQHVKLCHLPSYSDTTDQVSVLSQAEVAGVAADDVMGMCIPFLGCLLNGAGVITVLMFWDMLEIGVAMVAACLPVLRPLLRAWSPESIVNRSRSAVALLFTGGGSKSSPTVKENAGPFKSKTTIMGIPEAGNSGFEGLMSLDVEAYAMGKVSGENMHGITAGAEGIWRETEVTQIFAFRE